MKSIVESLYESLRDVRSRQRNIDIQSIIRAVVENKPNLIKWADGFEYDGKVYDYRTVFNILKEWPAKFKRYTRGVDWHKPNKELSIFIKNSKIFIESQKVQRMVKGLEKSGESLICLPGSADPLYTQTYGFILDYSELGYGYIAIPKTHKDKLEWLRTFATMDNYLYDWKKYNQETLGLLFTGPTEDD